MNIIDKVNRSRYTLKEVLEDEWNVDSVPDVSNQEIEKIYTLSASMDANIAPFGIASACNFSLSHKFLPSYKLHVIYFNFPEIGKNNSKVTKSACDKIINLYESDLVHQDDSLFIIINDKYSESLEKSFQTLNTHLQSKYNEVSIEDNIVQEMKDSDYYLENKHFRNVHLFDINELTNNILKHRLVPKHNIIRKSKDINHILESNNCLLSQLPIILKNDTCCKLLRVSTGDICEIERVSRKSGNYSFYRVCK
jgi:DNA-directed RNA polymerase subunit H (RpoH/RPB5)